MFIGATAVRGAGGEFHAIDPSTGSALEPAFGNGGEAEVARACALAAEATHGFRDTAPSVRAELLEKIAANVLALGDELVDRAVRETALPRGRIEGERGRTVGQLRMFARTVRDGHWQAARIDRAQPERTPAPRADLRLRRIGVGPVAVFGASNFPLAFSVAGGDTASALAAGCPVVVKAHHAHPGTSALVGAAIRDAVRELGLHEGTFSLLFGAGSVVGAALVADARIQAVGFTGSRSGGTALMRIAAARPQPIPVYAEMSSINPVLLLPGALAERGAAIGKAFVGSLTLGCGQFCTNPGLVVALDGPGLDAFIASASDAVGAAAAATMLTPGIHAAYESGIEALARVGAVQRVAQGGATTGPNQARPAFFEASASAFLQDERLHAEVFGPASLLVRCRSTDELKRVLAKLEGQLTIAVHLAAADHELVRELRPLLEDKAGRLLVNGFGTGVEVCDAMVHGGPWPATSDARTTSVGTMAIERFLRPVCYQDFPGALLPDALQDGNPLRIARLVEGRLSQD